MAAAVVEVEVGGPPELDVEEVRGRGRELQATRGRGQMAHRGGLRKPRGRCSKPLELSLGFLFACASPFEGWLN